MLDLKLKLNALPSSSWPLCFPSLRSVWLSHLSPFFIFFDQHAMWVFSFFSFLICFSVNHIDMHVGSLFFLISLYLSCIPFLLVDWLVVATGYYTIWFLFWFLNSKVFFSNKSQMLICSIWGDQKCSFSISFQISIHFTSILFALVKNWLCRMVLKNTNFQ